jgi:hypothetical protein
MADQVINWVAVGISAAIWLLVAFVIVWALRDIARIYNEWNRERQWMEYDPLCKWYRDRGDEEGLEAQRFMYRRDQWIQRQNRKLRPRL